jgi:hypothetical protein
MNTNLVVIIKENPGTANEYHVHAEGCGDVERFLTRRGWKTFGTYSKYTDFAYSNFSDLASDYVAKDATEEYWTKATLNEASYYAAIKACCKKTVDAEIAPYAGIEVVI